MKNRIVFVLAVIWQMTYGIIQSLIGALVFLRWARCPHFIYRGSIMTSWKREDGVSLGLFAFVPERCSEGFREHIIRHEYGHCVQSMILGPLYLAVIGLPSMFWNVTPLMQRYRRDSGIAYEQFYTESWANRMGGTVRWQ